MKSLKLIFTLSLTLLFVGFTNAQDNDDTATDNHQITVGIPEVAILDIEPDAAPDITMNFTAPLEAGLPLTNPTDNTDLWLNYSSIVGTETSRIVTVKVDAVIPGVDILVAAAADAAGGEGTVGSPTAQLTLTDTDQNIVTAIGSCYTGDGTSKGHNLTYSVEAANAVTGVYADIVDNGDEVVVVTYTISDN